MAQCWLYQQTTWCLYMKDRITNWQNASRQAGRQTDGQTDKNGRKIHLALRLRHYASLPCACTCTCVCVCMCETACVLKGARQMEGLRKPQNYVWKEALPVEACPPLPYHLLFPLFIPLSSFFTFNMLHISLLSPPQSCLLHPIFFLLVRLTNLCDHCVHSVQRNVCVYMIGKLLKLQTPATSLVLKMSLAFCEFVSVLVSRISVRPHLFILLPSGVGLCCVRKTVVCVSAKVL